MAYHRYTNLCGQFRGDLISKLNADVESFDFMDRPCNCNKTNHVNGECAYKAYVGCTQDTFKSRMTHHFTDITRLISTSKLVLPSDNSRQSDTFAKHFAKHFPWDANPQQLQENLDLD
eukprot:5458299-Ditylum_brightwellii.AAC.1